MFEIIPGILEKEWSEIERKIELVRTFAKTVHIDIIDGKFALASPPASPRGEQGGPNTTFLDPLPFKEFSTDLFLELHMMVENPIQYLKPFADAGFKRFIGHVEMMPDQVEFVAQAQLLGEVGLAIDGATNLDAIKVPHNDLDEILIMTIKAGQSGQTFNPEYLKKVEALSGLVIGVDGGINDKTIVLAKNAGATRFVANSFIFNSQDPQKQYEMLSGILK